MPRTKRRALVANYSELVNDPRVSRQIEWLTGDGWEVDSLGQGARPPLAKRHFEMTGHRGAARSALTRFVIHLVRGPRASFRRLELNQIPPEVRSTGGYDLVVVNDIELLPWAADPTLGGSVAPNIHLDLNEFHEWRPFSTAERLARPVLSRYHRWLMSHVASDTITSYTTVAPGIARLYRERYGIMLPDIVRNSPPYVELAPTPVHDPIELVYHGNPDLERGLRLMVEAMPLIDDRFRLTLMLTGSSVDHAQLKADAVPLGERVRFVPPVGIDDVAAALNDCDLEIIFFPPIMANLKYVLPNKFFEAVQGRLGMVIGASVEMVVLLEQYGLGAVASGWTATDLAATINSLTREDVRGFKEASHHAARDLSSDTEGINFLLSVERGFRSQAGQEK